MKSKLIKQFVLLSFLCSILAFSIVDKVYSSYPNSENKITIIDGRGKPVSIEPHMINNPIIIINAPNTIIEDLVYSDGSTIFLIDSDNSVIRNNSIENADSYAIFVELSANIQIYNNTILSGTNDGIISYLNNNVIIKNNSVNNVVKNGIFVRSQNVSVSENKIQNIEGSGIYIESSNDLIVKNNQINNVDWTPIATDQTSFDNGEFDGNTYNGEELGLDEIDPSIPNSITSGMSPITKTNETNGVLIWPLNIILGILTISTIKRSKIYSK